MPPMSRPLTTACATVASIGRAGLSAFHERRARVVFGKHRRQIAVLPLHPDRMGVDVLAVGAEFDFAAGTHRGVALRYVERRDGIAHLLRVGGSRALERV